MTEKNVICKNCIMIDGFLGITIDENQLCNFCADPNHANPNWSKKHISEDQRKKGKENWYETVKKMQSTHDEEKFDCVIGYSGGKVLLH